MSLNMNLAQARVIDPILTNVVQGYTNSELVGDRLFPIVPVDVSGGKIIEFDKAAFRLDDSQRAPGTNAKRVLLGYQGKPFVLENHALDAQVPREFLRDAAEVPGIDLSSASVMTVMEKMRLKLEYQQAQLARNAALYDVNHKVALTGTSKWTDPTSTPDVDVRAAREAIRSTIGRYPNTLLLSAVAFSALSVHPTLVDKFKYTSADSLTTAMLANYFRVKNVVVGEAVYADDADALNDVWGNDAVLAYVPETLQKSIHQPSYGYTYTMRGHPMVEPGYWDKGCKSWIFGVGFERAAVLSGITSGFLFQGVA